MPNQSLLSWQNHLWTLGALAVYLTWRVWDEVLLNSIFFSCYYSIMISYPATGKSFSEAVFLESVNSQYDKTLFIEFPEKYNFTTCSVQILLWMSKQKQKNNFRSWHVVNLYFSWNSMNNLLSYIRLTDARMRASEKDLPVLCTLFFPRSYQSAFFHLTN